MEKTESEKKLSKIVERWESGYYIASAILDDYCSFKSNQTGQEASAIREHIIEAAKKKRESESV